MSLSDPGNNGEKAPTMMSSAVVMRLDVPAKLSGGCEGEKKYGKPVGITSHQETYGCTLKITNTPRGTECQLLRAHAKVKFHFGGGGAKSIKVNANVLISN